MILGLLIFYWAQSKGWITTNVTEEGEEMAEVIQEGEMPPPVFLITHPEARLTDAEKQALIQGLQAVGGSENEHEGQESDDHETEHDEENEANEHDDD